MPKVDIKRLDSVTNNDTTATKQINDNFQALQQAIENTISRDGTIPNYMDANFDLNSYRIINAGDPVGDQDVVTLKYFEERAGGAVEAAAEAKASASKAASSAQSALVASNNAIGQLAQAEGLLTATEQFVDSAKADINTAVSDAESTISTIVSDAEGSITNIAVTEANKAIANAAQEATDTATANVNSYVDGTVKPSLQTYVDQAQADANSAATSMEQAALSATAASNYANNASAEADNSAESAGLAANSATAAATSETNAKASETSAKIWAEGTDAQVQALGGEKSAKGWAEASTAVNYTNITNCITEIPQDIKLELNNGTLTLKAGSTYYKCDGSFTKVTTSQDYSKTNVSNGYRLVFFTGNGFDIPSVQDCNSGTSEPTTGNKWFNTSNNILYSGGSGNWQQKTNYSLPLAIITVSDGTITSIDQVFNGFGYIGSTVFALPGVKGLIPNGRNADGSLKNIEFTVESVWTKTFSSTYTYSGALISAYNTLAAWGESDYSYNEEENFVKFKGGNYPATRIGNIALSTGVITSFTTKTAFHAVDYRDLSEVAKTVESLPKHKVVSSLPTELEEDTFYYIPEA